MKCIKEMEQELNWVKNTREYIALLLESVADVSVLIGGSYALKYQCDCFSEREITDYDFIVRVHKKNASRVLNLFRLFERLHMASQGYSGNQAFKLPHNYKGKNAECIIVPVEDNISISARNFGRTWEKPINIIRTKEEYIASYKAKGLEPRPKDVADIQNYYQNEDLPF